MINESKIQVLYLDDEWHNLIGFYAYFRTEKNYEVHICQTVDEGLALLNEKEINIIVADQRMPDITGVEFLEQAVLTHPEPMRIVLTAHRNIVQVEKAFEHGLIFRFHQKPCDLDEIKKSIEDAFEEYCRKKSSRK
jgi:DNA-binding NtrC family response regulator